jgi:hypothetical protein
VLAQSFTMRWAWRKAAQKDWCVVVLNAEVTSLSAEERSAKRLVCVVVLLCSMHACAETPSTPPLKVYLDGIGRQSAPHPLQQRRLFHAPS